MRKPNIKPLDAVVLLLALAGTGYLVWRVSKGFRYDWEWGVIPQYLFRFDQEKKSWVPNMLIEGLFTTIRLSIWSMLLATVLGTVMGIFRVSHSLFKRMVGRTYVEIVRNLPPLILVFIFYFFFSEQILPYPRVADFIQSLPEGVQGVLTFLFAPPDQFAGFMSAVITLAVYEGAYIAEIVRAGIQSVEKGQWEASYALGLSWLQQMRWIIMPQAVQRIVPPLAGQFISTIKDSAIVAVISIQELTYQGLQLMATTYLTFEVWTTVTALYLVLTLSCSLAARKLELYMQRGRA